MISLGINDHSMMHGVYDVDLLMHFVVSQFIRFFPRIFILLDEVLQRR